MNLLEMLILWILIGNDRNVPLSHPMSRYFQIMTGLLVTIAMSLHLGYLLLLPGIVLLYHQYNGFLIFNSYCWLVNCIIHCHHKGDYLCAPPPSGFGLALPQAK